MRTRMRFRAIMKAIRKNTAVGEEGAWMEGQME